MRQNLLNDTQLTPQQIVVELDKFIVGQKAAKRAVAIALRNRWRRQRVPTYLRDEIVPKNIILIGSTGVGKTEIARRLAKLVQAPFIKIEASKFTEVGYVGRDVESIIRDLIESAVQMVREEEKIRVQAKAQTMAEERLLDLLLPKAKENSHTPTHNTTAGEQNASREHLRHMLHNKELDDRQVEIDSDEQPRLPMMQVFPNAGMEEIGNNLRDMMSQMMGSRSRKRRVAIPEALQILAQEEAQKLIDQDWVVSQAILRTQQHGIVFLDEIDKIARREGTSGGPDVSREGVQRDILPIVEGATVSTKYGLVHTDHILFIAAGAFHVSKVSDLIPELQGRFPIRVELEPLGQPELLRILQEPQNALPLQYSALLATEGVEVTFTDNGLQALAGLAAAANEQAENIGARRLHTVLERLLEDISFHAPERDGEKLVVDADFVHTTLGEGLHTEDLTRYIL